MNVPKSTSPSSDFSKNGGQIALVTLKAEPFVEPRIIGELTAFEEVEDVTMLSTESRSNALTDEDPVAEEVESDERSEAEIAVFNASESASASDCSLNELSVNERVSPPTANVFAEAARAVEEVSVEASLRVVASDTELVAGETPSEAAVGKADGLSNSERREELLTAETEASERELAVTGESVVETEAVFEIRDCETLEDVASEPKEAEKAEVGSVNAVSNISPRLNPPSD
jgi:hypothetical protein